MMATLDEKITDIRDERKARGRREKLIGKLQKGVRRASNLKHKKELENLQGQLAAVIKEKQSLIKKFEDERKDKMKSTKRSIKIAKTIKLQKDTLKH